jgi:hypothetical protein
MTRKQFILICIIRNFEAFKTIPQLTLYSLWNTIRGVWAILTYPFNLLWVIVQAFFKYDR